MCGGAGLQHVTRMLRLLSLDMRILRVLLQATVYYYHSSLLSSMWNIEYNSLLYWEVCIYLTSHLHFGLLVQTVK